MSPIFTLKIILGVHIYLLFDVAIGSALDGNVHALPDTGVGIGRGPFVLLVEVAHGKVHVVEPNVEATASVFEVAVLALTNKECMDPRQKMMRFFRSSKAI